MAKKKRTDFAARPSGLVGQQAESYFRARAFEIAGVLFEEVLHRSKRILLDALTQDKTLSQILFELDQELADYLPVRDAAGRLVNVPARLETIARTSAGKAVSEGRYAAFTDPDLEGYVTGFEYTAILDSRTRETHAAWDGVRRPVNDAIWFQPDRRPLNGFQCRCGLLAVTAIDEPNWTPDSGLPLRTAGPDKFPDPGFK